MWKLTLKSLLDRKLRLALTMLAIVLGVSFVVASFVVTDSLRSTFNQLVTDIEGNIDLTARRELEFGDANNRQTIEESYLERVRNTEGVEAAVGRLFSANIRPIKANGESVETTGPPQLGINYAEVPSLSGLIQKEGRPPQNGEEFNLDITAAADNDFVVGERYDVITPGGRRSFTLVGTVAFNSESNDTVGAIISVFDTRTAQQLFQREGGYNEIGIELADDGQAGAVSERIKAFLPADAEVVGRDVKIDEGQADFNEISSIFGNVLLTFAIISVVVAAFIINNTFQIVLGQRIRELALLRAIGATGRQVSRSVMGEAAIIGVVATAVGVGLGVLVALGLKALLDSIGFGLPDGPIRVAPRTWVWAIAVGVGVTLLAAISPARRSRKVPPIAALRSDFQLAGTGLKRRLVVGSGILLLGVVLMALGLFGDLATAPLIATLALGALTVFVGVNLVSPIFARKVALVIGRPPFGWIFVGLGALLALGAAGTLIGGIVMLAQGEAGGVGLLILAPILLGLAWLSYDGGLGARGKTGQLARENAARNPRRTSSTAAALMIGLALVSMAAVVGDSLKKSFLDILDNSVQADYFIRNEDGNQDPTAALPTEYTAILAALPEVDTVVPYRFAFSGIKVLDDVKDVNATDLTTFSAHLDIDVKEGDPGSAGGAGLLVHQDSAKDNGISVGDRVEVSFPDGTSDTLTVTAIYADASILGNWVISIDTWDAHFPSREDQFLTATIKEGVDPEAAKQALRAASVPFPQAQVEDRDEFQESQQNQLDSFLAIINAFLFLAVVIAFIGIVNTMSLSVFERTRELGLLRAVGTTREQLRRIVKWEAGIVAMFGGLLGIGLGVLFGIAAVAAIPDSIIKSTSIPVQSLLIYLVFAGLAGLVAAWFPARRAGRLNVLDAIASE